MNMSSRLLAPSGQYIFDEQRVELDASAVIRRLLLFDTYILNSTRLLEMPELVKLFGLSGLMTLLDNGCLKIRCEAISFGHMEEMVVDSKACQAVFPMKDILLIKAANHKDYISNCLQNVHKARINQKEAIKLKRQVVNSFQESPSDLGSASLISAREDLKNKMLMSIVIGMSLREIAKVEVPPEAITTVTHQVSSEKFEIETNITSLVGIDNITAQKTLDNAFRALGVLNLRIEEMQAFNAISGVIGDDLAALVNKFNLVAKVIAGSLDKEQAFTRVVEIVGLHDGPINGIIDVDKLLRIRESSECIEFREWLKRLNSLSDVEVKRMVSSFQAKASSLLHGGPGKIIRLLVPTVIGLMPDLGLVGAGLAALDAFIAEKILVETGPAAFVNRLYPSIFPEQVNNSEPF